MGKRWWNKATGITKVKRQFARATGIPTTRSGRQAKAGRALGCSGAVFLAAAVALGAAAAGCENGRKPDAGNGGGGATASLPGNEVIGELIDHPERFKGKTLRLKLRLDESIHPKNNHSLRDYAGKEVKFNNPVGDFGPQLALAVKMPEPSADLPAASYADTLLITFTCKDGSLRTGNVATAVTRP